MISFLISTATNLSNHGASYSQLEQQGQEIINSLRDLRTQKTVDYLRESQLIGELQEVERGKNSSTLDAGARVAYTGAKSLIPGSELTKAACDVLVNTTEKSKKNKNGLGKNLIESVVQEGKKKMRGAVLAEAKKLATNVIGTATIVAAAPAILAAGGIAGTIALATHPTLAGRCKNFGLNLSRGFAAFAKQSFKLVRKDQAKSILESFRLYDETKVELSNTKAEKSSKKIVIALARSRLETFQLQLRQARTRLDSSRSSLIGRLVFRVNRSNGFYRFLTSLFCMLSRRFKVVKREQDATRLQIANLQGSIERENSNLRILDNELRILRSSIANIKVVVEQRQQDYLNCLQ
jgi:hypothetical protein